MSKTALSIRNPISYLVASGAKWVENRTWKTDYRGRIYIHSSGDKSFDCLTIHDFPSSCSDDYSVIQKKLGNNPSEEEIYKMIKKLGETRWTDATLYAESCAKLEQLYKKYYGSWSNDIEDRKKLIKNKGYALKNYAIIGHVDLVNIVDDCRSAYAEYNCYHWIFDNPVLYEKPVLNVKGKLRLFDVSHITMPDD